MSFGCRERGLLLEKGALSYDEGMTPMAKKLNWYGMSHSVSGSSDMS